MINMMQRDKLNNRFSAIVTMVDSYKDEGCAYVVLLGKIDANGELKLNVVGDNTETGYLSQWPMCVSAELDSNVASTDIAKVLVTRFKGQYYR